MSSFKGGNSLLSVPHRGACLSAGFPASVHRSLRKALTCQLSIHFPWILSTSPQQADNTALLPIICPEAFGLWDLNQMAAWVCIEIWPQNKLCSLRNSWITTSGDGFWSWFSFLSLPVSLFAFLHLNLLPLFSNCKLYLHSFPIYSFHFYYSIVSIKFV